MKPFVRYPVRPTSSGLHPIPVRTIAASRPEENKEFTTSSVPGRMRRVRHALYPTTTEVRNFLYFRASAISLMRRLSRPVVFTIFTRCSADLLGGQFRGCRKCRNSLRTSHAPFASMQSSNAVLFSGISAKQEFAEVGIDMVPSSATSKCRVATASSEVSEQRHQMTKIEPCLSSCSVQQRDTSLPHWCGSNYK